MNNEPRISVTAYLAGFGWILLVIFAMGIGLELTWPGFALVLFVLAGILAMGAK